MPNPLHYDPQFKAKAADPATSYHAADQAKGLAERHYTVIFAYLNDTHPHKAHYRHIGSQTGLDPHAVARRLPEMERAGLVERGSKVRMGNGRLAQTWGAK